MKFTIRFHLQRAPSLVKLEPKYSVMAWLVDPFVEWKNNLGSGLPVATTTNQAPIQALEQLSTSKNTREIFKGQIQLWVRLAHPKVIRHLLILHTIKYQPRCQIFLWIRRTNTCTAMVKLPIIPMIKPLKTTMRVVQAPNSTEHKIL